MLKHKFYFMIIFLLASILFISVGFSAMSTTLTVNGNVAFKPVDMIRVIDLQQNTLKDSQEVSSQYTIDGINIFVDIDGNGYASYDVTIINLGEVDKELSSIEEEIFSNQNIEYSIENLEVGDVISAKETVEFKIKFECGENCDLTQNSLHAKLKFNFEDYVFVPTDYQILFDANGGSGVMSSIDVKANEAITLPSNEFTNGNLSFGYWNTKKDGTGTSYSDSQEIKNINLDNTKKVTLYAQWSEVDSNYIKYNGDCIFNGKGNDVVGDCSVDSKGDYIDTGITLFSEENYQKNFILSFTLTDVDDSRFVSGKRDTFFSALYEANNNIAGKYPGVLFRIENSKFVLHISNGQNTSTYATDVWFTKDEFINKEFKLIRYNDGGNIKFYYILGNSGPILLRDLTDLNSTFDTPLTFGANVAIDNVTSDRHSIGTLSDIFFKFATNSEVSKLLNINSSDVTGDSDINDDSNNNNDNNDNTDDNVEIVTDRFSLTGPCIFNGSSANILGNSCTNYSNINYINTNINLFSEENYKKDFDLSFTIDDYLPSNQEVSQVTLMNAFLETSSRGYGILFRRNGNKLDLIVRDGNGSEKSVTFAYDNVKTLRLVRKNNNVCYSINGGSLVFTVNFDKFSAPFSVPLTFGSSIDKKGIPFRFINGTLSNMYVILGKIDDNIICEKG